MRTQILLMIIISLIVSQQGKSQALSVYYTGPQTYTAGVAIGALNPTVTGGPAAAGGQTTQTFAGAGSAGYSNSTGTGAYFNNPINTAVDSEGNVYVTDAGNHVVRKITPVGVVTTLAGGGTPGFADGTGALARFQHPSGIVVDLTGNVFVSDQQNHRIRKITPAGVVTTLAGSGTAGALNGTGTSASFNYPIGLTLDAAGNLYVCDSWNNKIRKITPAGVVTDFAGSGIQGSSDSPSYLSASFNKPTGIVVDETGNFYITDRYNHRIRKIGGGWVSTFAGSGSIGSAAGSSTSASFNYPTMIAIDPSGNLFVSDQANNMVRKITSAGMVSNFAGATSPGTINGTGSVVRFNSTYGLSLDKQGNIYVAENGAHSIRKMATQPFTIFPNLPSGLSFSNSTGAITGTPLVVSASKDYFIQGFNITHQSNLTTLNITVNLSSAGIEGSVNQNYIAVYTPKVSGLLNEISVKSASSDKSKVQTRIQYFDGLGRESQTVTVMGNNDGTKDLVTVNDYDDLGRLKANYLPYVASTANGSYRSSGISEVVTYYQGSHPNVVQTSYPYSKPEYEPSPLGRLLQQGAPGAAWQPFSIAIAGSGHTQRVDYRLNAAADTVKKWALIVNGASTSSMYNSGELQKTIQRNENWTSGNAGTIDDYTDTEGQLVCRRAWESNTVARTTYYIYDNSKKLRYIIPPIVTVTSFTESDPQFNQYITASHYDDFGRIIENKYPVKGWEEIVYDKLHRIVLTRNAMQAASSKWLFNKYDTLGRSIISGIISSSASRTVWQNAFNSTTVFSEQKDNTNTSGSGTGYTNVALPLHSAVQYYHKINYYDDYSFYGNSFGNPVVGQISAVKGLLTATRVNVLGSGTMLLSTNYYNDRDQLVQSKSANHLGGTDIFDFTYDFSGQMTSKVRSHIVASNTTMVYQNYEYDHLGKRTKTYSKIGNSSSPQVLLSELSYNEIGQLKDKNLHNATNTTTFSYNEPGWLKSAISNEFSYRLKYNDGSGPQFAGNISNQDWGIGSSFPNTFTYTYDKLNRLSSSVSTGVVLSENITYDPIGNIKTMNRNGTGISTYNYSQNKLSNISGGGIATGAYAYDLNGNAITDGRTGVALTYNAFDLPATATKTGVSMTYTYDAEGRKLSEVNSSTATAKHFVDGIEYNGGNIEVIRTDEGVASNNAGVYTYQYYLTDHVGNVRFVFYKHPTSGAIVTLQQGNYQAFGKYVPVVGGTNPYLFNGKRILSELNSAGEGGEYDFGARLYDPVTGRWNVLDPANQFSSISGYASFGNNPVMYVDPDGRFIWLVPALIGGVVNLGIKAVQGKIHNFKDGFVAFGIGALAGGVGALTGGAAVGALGWTTSSIGGGAIAGLAGGATSSAIQGVGNAAYFGDTFTVKDFVTQSLTGAVAGGIAGGVFAKPGTSIWTGKGPSIAAGPAKIVGTLQEIAEPGNTSVYTSVDDGVTQYVGITDDIARRSAEHLSKKGINITELMANISRADARSVEQALIQIHKLGKDGGTLINIINSIAKSNPIYKKSLERGYELLRSIGYH